MWSPIRKRTADLPHVSTYYTIVSNDIKALALLESERVLHAKMTLLPYMATLGQQVPTPSRMPQVFFPDLLDFI